MSKLIAANWKMYKTGAEARNTVAALAAKLHGECPADKEVLVFAPHTALEATCEAMRALRGGQVGAQNMYPATEGAFTGEISPLMIRESGATWVLVGHSERRHVLGEHDDFIAKKVAFAVESNVNVMLCVGETLEQREQGQLETVLRRQLASGLSLCHPDFATNKMAIAYEPVWAIGTGKTASESDVLAAHTLVRNILKDVIPPKATTMRILYGGSVKIDNAALLLALDNVDGLLVGGASLQANTFAQIVLA